MKFNLKDLLVKEAMGAAAYRYRNQTKWSKLEDVIVGDAIALEDDDGNHVTWGELIKKLPSLLGVVYDIVKIKQDRERFLAARYYLPKEQIDSIFSIIVGYHPMYGAYAASVGPYFTKQEYWKNVGDYLKAKGRSGEITTEELDFIIETTKDAPKPLNPRKMTAEQKKIDPYVINRQALMLKTDMKNRFSFFIRRYPKVNADQIRESLHQFIYEPGKGLMSKFIKDASFAGLELELKKTNKEPFGLNGNDFMIKAKKFSGNIPGGSNPKSRSRYDETIYNSLDPNSPEGQKLYEEDSPILGANSVLQLNGNGLAKILEGASRLGNWGEVYNQALAQVAQSNGNTVEELKVIMRQDMDLMEKIVTAAKDIQGKMYSQEISAGTMRPIPDFNKMSTVDWQTGSQGFEALDTKESQVATALLRKEILATIVRLKTTDPAIIATALQEARRSPHLKLVKAKGEITPDHIRLFLASIKKEKIIKGPKGKFIGNKSYEQMSAEANKAFDEVLQNKDGKVNEGFSDMTTAIGQMSAHLLSPGEDAIDPLTKARISLQYAPAPQLVSTGVNINSQKMTEFRIKAREVGSEEELMKKLPWKQPIDLYKTIFDKVREDRKEKSLTAPEITEEDIKAEKELMALDTEVKGLEEKGVDIGDIIPEDKKSKSKSEKTQKAGRDLVPLSSPENLAKAKSPEQSVEEPEITDEDINITEQPVEGVEGEPELATAPVEGTPEDFPVTEIPRQEVPQEVAPTARPTPEPIANQQALQTPQAPQAPLGQTVPEKEKRKKTKKPVNTLGNTLVSLIKIAKELDDNGKFDAAEQIHNVIRKYQARII